MLQGKVSSTLLPYFSSPKTGLNHGLSTSKLSKPTKLIKPILCHQQVWAAWSFHQGLSSIAGSSPLTNSWNFHEFPLALAMHLVYWPTCHQQPVCISTKTLKWQWFSLWISRPNRTYVLTPCWPWVNSMVRNNPQFWSASHRSVPGPDASPVGDTDIAAHLEACGAGSASMDLTWDQKFWDIQIWWSKLAKKDWKMMHGWISGCTLLYLAIFQDFGCEANPWTTHGCPRSGQPLVGIRRLLTGFCRTRPASRSQLEPGSPRIYC